MIMKHEMTAMECAAVLEKCDTGILSMKGLDEFPYSVPVNYVFVDGKIYMHGKSVGTKVQNIQTDSHVTFCVIENAEVVSEELTTKFCSVVVYGTAKMLETREEKYDAMEALVQKYSPGVASNCMQKLKHENSPQLGIVEVTPIKMTGKQSKI